MKSCLCCVKRHVGIVELPDTQRSASCRFQQDGAGKPLVISFVHAHVADRCEHDRTPLRGPYFTAVCPTSSRSASLHFQQRDGKTADRTETRRRTEESFWVFFSGSCLKTSGEKTRRIPAEVWGERPNGSRCHALVGCIWKRTQESRGGRRDLRTDWSTGCTVDI